MKRNRMLDEFDASRDNLMDRLYEQWTLAKIYHRMPPKQHHSTDRNHQDPAIVETHVQRGVAPHESSNKLLPTDCDECSVEGEYGDGAEDGVDCDMQYEMELD